MMETMGTIVDEKIISCENQFSKTKNYSVNNYNNRLKIMIYNF